MSHTAEDIRLKEEEVNNYRGAPYFLLGVDVTNDPKTYIDTESLEMMYNPIVYTGSWQSNHSVVMKIERDVFSGKFSIQNVVIPNQYLVIKMDIPVAELPRQGRPNAIIKRDVRFEGKNQSEALFERIINPTDNSEFAFRQTKSLGGMQLDFYLTPMNSSGEKKVIAVWDNTGPAGKYYFTLYPSTYPN